MAGHKSQSLGRTKYIAIYRMHSAGQNIIRNISDALRSDHKNLVYIPTHESELEKKEKLSVKVVKVVTTI